MTDPTSIVEMGVAGRVTTVMSLFALLSGCTTTTPSGQPANTAVGVTAVRESSAATAANTQPPQTDTPTVTEPATLPGADQRDGLGNLPDAAPLLPPEKQQIVDGLAPITECPDLATPPVLQPGPGEVVLDVIRAVGGCITIESTVIPAGEIDQRAAEASAEPDVISAGPATRAVTDDSFATRSLTTNDVDLPKQKWWLDELDVTALDAFTVTDNSPKVRVAVIDNGIDDSNPDLAGLVVGRVPWRDAPNPANPEGIKDPEHGTHVAGIIAAYADNLAEGRGVSRHTELLDVNDTLLGGPSTAFLIVWAVVHGADIINMSICETIGDPCLSTPNTGTAAAVAYALSKGVLLFASAGNCGPNQYKVNPQCGGEINRIQFPASYNGVIAVGAYSEDGNVSDFSTRNAYVDVSAPGDKIYSTVFGGVTKSMSGTSQATPMVSGAAAAILAHRPDIDHRTVGTTMFSKIRLAGPPGWDVAYGNGKVSPVAVANSLDNGTPLPPTASPATIPDIKVTYQPEPITGDLMTGHQGPRVFVLQTLLNTVGQLSSPADGYFGLETAAAVLAFKQITPGLTRNGIADTKTMHALDVAAGGIGYATMQQADEAVLAYLNTGTGVPTTGWLAQDLKGMNIFGGGFVWSAPDYGAAYPTTLDYTLGSDDSGGVVSVLDVAFEQHDGLYWYAGITELEGH